MKIRAFEERVDMQKAVHIMHDLEISPTMYLPRFLKRQGKIVMFFLHQTSPGVEGRKGGGDTVSMNYL